MDIRNTRQLKDFAAQRLGNAQEGQKIVLLYTAIALGVTALVTIVNYCLNLRIDQMTGLGGMGARSMLTTVQTLLPVAQALFLMCLDLGYLSTMLRVARGQYASPNGLRLGFDRFWVLLRCNLLRGLIYFGLGMASVYAAMMIYLMSPLASSAMELLTPMVTAAAAAGETSITLDDAAYAQLMSAMTPALILCAVLFLAVAAPFFYRYRMADYLLIDRPGIGAVAALRESRKMMKGHRVQLLKLDLSLWWFYAAMLAASVICYGDLIFPALGISLPISGTAAYFVFFAAYVAATFAIYYFLRNRVEVTYALVYDSLRPREPEDKSIVLGNIFQM
ncbi:MAG: DUF975 family protein [Firmicutes bacterium]|nr:DUF975 family protein [Bacillota bacterium]